MKIALWRPALLLAGVTLLMGGPQHPSPHPDLSFAESSALMLANDSWVPSHLWMLASFALLLLALVLWQRRVPLANGARRWVQFTLVAAGLAVIEMAFHTAAVLDLERLRAGGATPIFTTHLTLAAIANPLLAIALAGVAVLGARMGRLGSRWLVWMIVLGGGTFGFASAYVVLTRDQRISPLFAIGSALMALWFALTAFWPARVSPARAPDSLRPDPESPRTRTFHPSRASS